MSPALQEPHPIHEANFQASLKIIAKNVIASPEWDREVNYLIQHIPKALLHRLRRWKQQQLIFKAIGDRAKEASISDTENVGQLYYIVQEELFKC